MHVGHGTFSFGDPKHFLNTTWLQTPHWWVHKGFFPLIPQRFPTWIPQDGAGSWGLGFLLQEEERSQQHRCKARQRKNNECNFPDPKWGFISRGIFLWIATSKHTSVTKIAHLLPQRTLLPTAVAPQEAAQVPHYSTFQPSTCQGSRTGLKTTQKPLKLPCKCSQAASPTFLSKHRVHIHAQNKI